ncbi:DUF3592 domain-containing protein [Flammeovirga sp. EKP202]|uniref:DUF3592 domain-containing protein n=1 Tax=Flammeovirga sp. EKP202 TaxID=2770592 RepID=UPI00165EBF3D|nr:DUF3592 domain-containing protein [Flammeovirga sp. EKP202]MBD0404080.1 hypothetical protein [Flammeovirga sp. EKP202]
MDSRIPISTKMVLSLNGMYGVIAIVSFLAAFFTSFFTLQSFDIKTLAHMKDHNLERSNGEIINVLYTNIKINGEPVYQYNYVFHSKTGDFNWTSFQGGDHYAEGDQVVVEYQKSKPHINRIIGMSHSDRDLFSIALLFVVAIFLFLNFWIGNNRINILSNGEITRAILKKDDYSLLHQKLLTNRMTLSYITKNGCILETSRFIFHPPQNTEYTLIYHKSNPKKTIIVEHLPWFIQKEVRGIYNRFTAL